MKWWIGSTLCAAMVLGLLFFGELSRRSTPTLASLPSQELGESSEFPALLVEKTVQREQLPESAPQEEPAENPPGPTSETEASLLVQVVGLADELPIARVGITIEPVGGVDVQLASRNKLTTSAGEAHFEAVLPGQWLIRSDRGDEQRVQLSIGEQRVVRLVISSGHALHVRVVERLDNLPIAGAEIWFARVEADSWYPLGALIGSTNDAGELVVEALPTGRYMVGAHGAGRLPSDRVVLSVEDEDLSITFQLDPHGSGLHIHVQDEGGLAIVGALVRVGPRLGWLPSAKATPQHLGPAVRCSLTDATGDMSAEGLPAGRVPVLIRCSGYAPWATDVLLGEEATERIDVVLHRAVALEGKVTNHAGYAIEGADVEVFGSARFEEARAKTRADGSFAFADLAQGTIQVQVRSKGYQRARQVFQASPGSTLQWNPILDASLTITGRIASASDSETSGWSVCTLEANGSRISTRTDDQGAFELGPLPGGAFAILVCPNAESTYWDSSAVIGNVSAGARDVTICVPDGAFNATLLGRYVDANGSAIAGAHIALSRENVSVTSQGTTDKAGAFRLENLAAGIHDLAFYAEGYPRLRLTDLQLLPGDVRDLGVVSASPVGFLVLHAAVEGDAGFESMSMATERLDDPQSRVYQGIDKDGRCRVALAPGSHRAILFGQGFSTRSAEFTIEADRTTTLELTLSAAVRRQLVFPSPPPAAWFECPSLEVELRHRKSQSVERIEFDGDDLWPFSWWPALEIGSYEVRVHAPGHPTLVGTFDLRSLDPSPEPIHILMRTER